jgi:uracil-DNA glycosylase
MTDLPALQRELAGCRLCLARGLRVESMPVFSTRARADAFLIGQAPGSQEAERRVPFTGPAGRRLRAWLAPAGLGDESSFYARLAIGSVVRCFPGKRPGGGDRPPPAAVVRTCAPWLRRELELIEAPLLVVVGAVALAELFPGVALDAAVGRTLRFADGRPAVPLPHPSGASPWPHRPGNAERLARAVALIGQLIGRDGTGVASPADGRGAPV